MGFTLSLSLFWWWNSKAMLKMIMLKTGGTVTHAGCDGADSFHAQSVTISAVLNLVCADYLSKM